MLEVCIWSHDLHVTNDIENTIRIISYFDQLQSWVCEIMWMTNFKYKENPEVYWLLTFCQYHQMLQYITLSTHITILFLVSYLFFLIKPAAVGISSENMVTFFEISLYIWKACLEMKCFLIPIVAAMLIYKSTCYN